MGYELCMRKAVEIEHIVCRDLVTKVCRACCDAVNENRLPPAVGFVFKYRARVSRFAFALGSVLRLVEMLKWLAPWALVNFFLSTEF